MEAMRTLYIWWSSRFKGAIRMFSRPTLFWLNRVLTDDMRFSLVCLTGGLCYRSECMRTMRLPKLGEAKIAGTAAFRETISEGNSKMWDGATLVWSHECKQHSKKQPAGAWCSNHPGYHFISWLLEAQHPPSHISGVTTGVSISLRQPRFSQSSY